MAESKCLFDLSCVNGAQSLFSGNTRDPFVNTISADFADLFIYNDTVKYPIIVRTDDSRSEPDVGLPPLLKDLIRRDSQSIGQHIVEIDQSISLADGQLAPTFERFASYVRNNRQRVRAFLDLQNQDWIRTGQFEKRLAQKYVFDFDKAEKLSRFQDVVRMLSATNQEVSTVFDIVLRYSIYGSLLEENEYYMAHPIRVQQNFPTMERKPTPPPNVPVRIGPSLSKIAPNMNQDEFTAFLHEARGIVRELEIINLAPGAIEPEAVRELAVRLKLPPRLKSSARSLGVAGGLVGGAGAVAVLGPFTAIGGGAISIASAFWNGQLPRSAARINWLHWAFQWDIEAEGATDVPDPKEGKTKP